MSARTQLADKLTTKLNRRRFAVIPAETLPDQIDAGRCAVVVRFRDYEPAPNALGNLVASFIVTLATATTDPRTAEDELDARLAEVIAAIDSFGIVWTKAEKVTVKAAYPGFDITLTVPTTPL